MSDATQKMQVSREIENSHTASAPYIFCTRHVGNELSDPGCLGLATCSAKSARTDVVCLVKIVVRRPRPNVRGFVIAILFSRREFHGGDNKCTLSRDCRLRGKILPGHE